MRIRSTCHSALWLVTLFHSQRPREICLLNLFYLIPHCKMDLQGQEHRPLSVKQWRKSVYALLACQDERSGPPGPSANMCEESSGSSAFSCMSLSNAIFKQKHALIDVYTYPGPPSMRRRVSPHWFIRDVSSSHTREPNTSRHESF